MSIAEGLGGLLVRIPHTGNFEKLSAGVAE